MKSYCSKTLTAVVLSLIVSTSTFGGVMQTDKAKSPVVAYGVMQTDAAANGAQTAEAGENTAGTLSAVDVVLELLRRALTLF